MWSKKQKAPQKKLVHARWSPEGAPRNPQNDIDPAVAAITRKDPEPGPAPKPDDKKPAAKPAPKK